MLPCFVRGTVYIPFGPGLGALGVANTLSKPFCETLPLAIIDLCVGRAGSRPSLGCGVSASTRRSGIIPLPGPICPRLLFEFRLFISVNIENIDEIITHRTLILYCNKYVTYQQLKNILYKAYRLESRYCSLVPCTHI